ncbi:hypothetical protein [Rhizobium leguminosarum]|uniref:Uncharacterized protein n=1 Tax=Rhizobium leguminosarum TaxID=384 RepID=A0A7K3VKA3_RHILE|nr:hypothetical protein [Rhizobium leguminosarum]NEK17192.1 hypothetical protein [Rhizobium leguminosarum]NEK37300.1 hypothetical protein [Rhizobium leguminosarum]
MNSHDDSEVVRFSSTHDLSDEHFARQKHKYLDHGRTLALLVAIRWMTLQKRPV